MRPGRAAAGEEIARFDVAGGEPVAIVRDSSGRVVVPFSFAEAYESYVLERWRDFVDQRKLSESQLNLFYRLKRFIPRRAQLAARRVLIRRQGAPEFPAWPLDDSVGRLVRLYLRCLLLESGRDEVAFRWFWPDGRRAAIILTHDVESAEGLRLAVELADLEEELGLRSSFNVVADEYAVDRGILRELSDRGFEIGVHGIYHDRSMFSSRESFEAQLPRVRDAAETFGAVGFRSPATHRVVDWLGELPVDYDCTMPHSDPYEPIPGGCCTIWPFFVGSVVELPYTLPQDHTLFTLLGHDSPELWLRSLDAIEQAGGLVQSVTHPDPGYLGDPGKRALYREFLTVVAGRESSWKALPRDVAAWWRDRDAGRDDRWTISRGVARRAGDEVELASE